MFMNVIDPNFLDASGMKELMEQRTILEELR